MCLAGDDLPIVVALKPCVSDVIACGEILAEDRLLFVQVVIEHGCIAGESALGLVDLDGAGISIGQWCDVRNKFHLVQCAPFLVGKNAIVRKIFSKGRRISGAKSVVKFLCAANKFSLRNGNRVCRTGHVRELERQEDDSERA